MATFRAVYKDHEILIPGLTKRLDFIAQDKVVLGRSTRTGIADASVDRKVCQVDTQTQTIRGCRPESTYFVNNTTFVGVVAHTLPDGATIGIPGGTNSVYEYTVHYRGDANQGTVTTNPTASSKTAKQSPMKKRQREVSEDQTKSARRAAEEFSCPICLEIMVEATSLVNCGHSFCKSCCSATECPTCRANVLARIPCRVLDNAIDALVEDGSFFEADDVKVYRERSHASGVAVQTPQRRRRKRRAPSAPAANAGNEDIIIIDD